MSNGHGSDRTIPVMPTDIAERSAQAWNMARRAKDEVTAATDRATEAYFELVGQVRSLRTEGDAREVRRQAWESAIGVQINALTHATRQVRRSTSGISEEDVRNELPTLPEIIVDEVRAELRRDSDRVQAQQLRTIKGWIKKGIGKAIATLVTAAVLATAGWLARDLLGPHAGRVLTHEAVPK